MVVHIGVITSLFLVFAGNRFSLTVAQEPEKFIPIEDKMGQGTYTIARAHYGTSYNPTDTGKTDQNGRVPTC